MEYKCLKKSLKVTVFNYAYSCSFKFITFLFTITWKWPGYPPTKIAVDLGQGIHNKFIAKVEDKILMLKWLSSLVMDYERPQQISGVTVSNKKQAAKILTLTCKP